LVLQINSFRSKNGKNLPPKEKKNPWKLGPQIISDYFGQIFDITQKLKKKSLGCPKIPAPFYLVIYSYKEKIKKLIKSAKIQCFLRFSNSQNSN
jgi:hypothetical protein